MRNLLIASTGFLAGAGLIAGLVLALPQPQPVTVTATAAAKAPAAARSAAPTPDTQDAMNASLTSGSRMTVARPQTASLTIQHVEHGCHVWSDGRISRSLMRLHLRIGQRLAVLDQDVDAHQLVELAGPAPLRLGRPLIMSHGTTIAFAKPGTYRLGTKTVPMPGAMDIKTVGPDNRLRLLVTVA